MWLEIMATVFTISCKAKGVCVYLCSDCAVWVAETFGLTLITLLLFSGTATAVAS